MVKTPVDDITRALEVLRGAGIRASEKRKLYVIPTDIKVINDTVFGCGGIPLGRVIEIFSKEGVGKSSFAYWLIGQVQKGEGNAALFDAEGAYTPEYGAGCGIDNDRLILPEFTHGEEALDQMKTLIASGTVDLIVADAMPAFQPLINVDQVAGERVTMNKNLERAKMFTRFFNDMMGGFKIKPPGKNQPWIKDKEGRTFRKLYETGICLIFINHSKTSIGVTFGSRTYTPGGDAINFATAIRIEMKHVKKKQKKSGDTRELEYRIVRIKAPKNKVAIPFGETSIKMYPSGRIEPLKEEVDDEEPEESEEEFEEAE